MPSRTSSRKRFRDSKVKVENVAAEYVAAGIEIEQSLEISNLPRCRCSAWIQQMSSRCQRFLKIPNSLIVDGMRSGDIAQGDVCDCWFLSSITAMSSKHELIEKICVVVNILQYIGSLYRETCQQRRNLYHKRQSIRKQSDARP
ncbi:hypothetical protein JB92DRAFT_3056770 [Gautieria morchelliformis]|nr:hypothetical protein JB92DRAFT_3056770 [Gautieria morchelliformis]